MAPSYHSAYASLWMRQYFAFLPALAMAAFLFHCADQENPHGVKVPDDDIFDAGGDGFVAPAKPEQPHANKNPQPKVKECNSTIDSAGGDVCKATRAATGTNTFKVIRGNVLAPEEVLHGGEVVFDDTGRIVCAACDCSDTAGYDEAAIISCPDGVISPGLINAHEHLTYQNNAPVVHAEKYENRSDWQGARGHTRLEYKSGANSLMKAYGELRFLMSGTTAITGSGGESGLLRNVDTSADELEGVPAQIAFSDVFPLGSPGKNLSSGCEYSKPRTGYTVIQRGAYIPHISEGIDPEAHNEFTCLSQDDSPNNLILPGTAVIHAVALKPDDAHVIRARGAKVVWSPRSNVDLYGNTTQAVMLDMAGVTIALGSDWIPSGSMNMLRELRCADDWNKTYFDNHFTDADLWRMVTINGALAVGSAHAIGMLKPSYLADLAVYDGRKDKDFRAILNAGVEDVALVLRGGRVMYGDTSLVTSGALTPPTGGAGCSAFPDGVCGKDKTACIDVRTTAKPNLEALLTEGAKYYPPFFCKDKVPDNEPSCHPSRPQPVRGSTVYDGNPTEDDKDGDGIPNSLDNCPAIFNPARPMDGARQADVDNDGIGDACDECPSDGNQSCERFSGADIDGDGVANGVDNCPETANPDQADGDGNGVGDACDMCPTGQMGAEGCPLAISTLRNPNDPDHPKQRSVVATEGYVVSRSSNNSNLYIQEDLVAAPWKGIYVQADALAGTGTTGPKIGQKIQVLGVHSSPFDQDQITAAQITVTDGTIATLVPLEVSAGQVSTAAKQAAEQYEGVFVKVTGPLTILNANVQNVTKATDDIAYELQVTGPLLVNDFLLRRWGTCATSGGQPCPVPPPDYSNGAKFTSITGVMGWSFSERKLYPRVKDDFVRP